MLHVTHFIATARFAVVTFVGSQLFADRRLRHFEVSVTSTAMMSGARPSVSADYDFALASALSTAAQSMHP